MLGSVIRNFLVLLGVTFAAFIVAQEYTPLFDATGSKSWSPAAATQRPSAGSAAVPHPSAEANQLVIEAGPSGHFMVNGVIRGQEIAFVVDTGASMVALSPAHAELLGYAIHQLDYAGRAQTPNGVARFAPIVIDEIAVGDIVMRNVPAAVLEKPMEKSLLGMTFLRRLAAFEIRGDRLILRW